MPQRVVIVGASGLVGGCALRYALDHPAVGAVTAIGRRRLSHDHPKLNEVLHADFGDCSSLSEHLSGQDAAVFCLATHNGVAAEAELQAIVVKYTIEFARTLRRSSPNAAFSLLVGGGADPAGLRWIRSAGRRARMENELLAAVFPHVYVFRPAFLHSVEPRGGPHLGHRLLLRIYSAFRAVLPSLVMPADDVGRVMVDAVVRRPSRREFTVFDNRDIRAMAAAAQHPQDRRV
jgi:uncharacterized protein YbjT (DUF2867 family)